MGEPIQGQSKTIGSPWCPCGKHKTKEQVVCFACFCSLPMVVKYGLCSLRLELREKAVADALRRADENREAVYQRSEGELFQ